MEDTVGVESKGIKGDQREGRKEGKRLHNASSFRSSKKIDGTMGDRSLWAMVVTKDTENGHHFGICQVLWSYSLSYWFLRLIL